MTSHFHPLGQLPSATTVAAQQSWRASLPFEDTRDFDEAAKGFIAAPEYRQIMAEAGHVAWDMGSYDFLLDGQDFDSVHPSLQRQASSTWPTACTRWSRATSTRSAASTWRTSASSGPTPAGSCSTR